MRLATRLLDVEWMQIGVSSRQRFTLEVGSSVLLSAVLLGVQVGRWSAWSVLAAAAAYGAWVIAYSEATVQLDRRRARRRELSVGAEPAPEDEEQAARGRNQQTAQDDQG